MKVWVPIDLPEGFRVREVIAEIGGMLGAVQTIKLVPCDDPTVDPPREQELPEPPRDGWEYHLWPMPSDDSMSGVELSCDTLGVDGWEAFAVVGSVVWFKRWMIP